MSDIIPAELRPEQEIVQDPIEVIQEFFDRLPPENRQIVTNYGLRALRDQSRELSRRELVRVEGHVIKHIFPFSESDNPSSLKHDNFKQLSNNPMFTHLGKVVVSDDLGESFAAEFFRASEKKIEEQGGEFREYLYITESPNKGGNKRQRLSFTPRIENGD